jgi:hypothetical protein
MGNVTSNSSKHISIPLAVLSPEVKYEREGGGPRMCDVKVYAAQPENNLEN